MSKLHKNLSLSNGCVMLNFSIYATGLAGDHAFRMDHDNTVSTASTSEELEKYAESIAAGQRAQHDQLFAALAAGSSQETEFEN